MSVVITGQIVVCLINGRAVGQVVSFSFRRQSAVKPLSVVDQYSAAELIRGPVVVSGKIGIIRVQRDGGPEALGMQPPVPNISIEQYVSLQLKDRGSDTVLFQADQCLFDSEDWEVSPQDFMKGQLSFVGIEVTPSVKARSV